MPRVPGRGQIDAVVPPGPERGVFSVGATMIETEQPAKALVWRSREEQLGREGPFHGPESVSEVVVA